MFNQLSTKSPTRNVKRVEVNIPRWRMCHVYLLKHTFETWLWNFSRVPESKDTKENNAAATKGTAPAFVRYNYIL